MLRRDWFKIFLVGMFGYKAESEIISFKKTFISTFFTKCADRFESVCGTVYDGQYYISFYTTDEMNYEDCDKQLTENFDKLKKYVLNEKFDKRG